jgi:hypothetical protein
VEPPPPPPSPALVDIVPAPTLLDDGDVEAQPGPPLWSEHVNYEEEVEHAS